MANVRRATFRFPALEGNPVEVIPEGQTTGVQNRQFFSDFPLVFDPVLAVSRPPETPEELEELGLFRNASYSSQEYFIGLSVNDIIIHDGVFKIVDGVTASFGQNPDSPATGSRGIVLIDTTKFNLGTLDLIQIAIIKANTYSPWLYYGSIPERSALANNKNNLIASQGAIFPLEESELLQAAGIRQFVDVFQNQLGANRTNLIPSFVAPLLSFAGGSTGSVSDLFFMGDVLDGDGSLGHRSFTTFKVLQLQEVISFEAAGFAAPAFTILRADAFRSIDYKDLSYQKTTFKIDPPVTESNFYFVIDQDPQLISFYTSVSDSFDLISEFIGFETVEMSVSLSSLSSDSTVIAQQFGEVEAIEDNAISGKITTTQQVIENDSSNRKKIALVISDLLTELGDMDDTEPTQFETNLREAVTAFDDTIADLKLGLIIQDQSRRTEAIQLANEVFGESNTIILNQSDTQSLGWLQFVGLLTESIGKTASENNLVEEEEGINVNTLKANMLRITEPSGSTTGTDHDGDGVISLIDTRHYELTLRFNPTRTFNPSSFLSTPASEMRFWRKVSPIGQLFNFVGTVVGSEIVRGSSLLLDVQIKWPDGAETPEPTNNIIKVYVEYGAQTNLTDLSGEIEFQGRLFYPGYMIKTNLNNIIGFDNYLELSSWFRVLLTTSRDLIDFGRATETQEEPLLIVRTNLVPSDTGTTGETGLSSIFSSDPDATSGPIASFDIAQNQNEIGDFLNVAEGDTRILLTNPVSAPVGTKIPMFDTRDTDIDIVITDIEFDILIPADSIPPNPGNETDGLIGNYEYEVLYQPASLDTDETVLNKFFSIVAFDGKTDESGENLVAKVKFTPHNRTTFTCKLTPEDIALPDSIGEEDQQEVNPDKNREFNVSFPYQKNNINEDFVWTWNESEWSFVIQKNSSDLNSFSFTNLPDPETGRFKLATPINPQEDIVTATFTNVAAGQTNIKKGSKVSVRAKTGPAAGGDEAVGIPEVANFKINFTTPKSIENVEGHFSSTAQGEDFYLMTPAHGFVALSGHGWFMQIEEGTAGAGGVNNTRITGDLSGPILFFDAFSSDIDDQIIGKTPGIPTAFPTVDIVFSNATNTFGLPFVEIFSILFEIPPPPDVDRITSTRSDITDRVTIVFNDENALQQKYSFTNFSDHDTENGWDFMQRSMRRSIPVYSDLIVLVEKQFEFENGTITFNAENTALVPADNTNADPTAGGDKTLVAIGLEFDRKGAVDPETFSFNQTITYELQLSVDGTTFAPFGYENGLGETSPQLIIVPDNNVFVQIPDSNGIEKIRLVPLSPEEGVPSPIKVTGAYSDKLITGRTPGVFETSFGEYILFFTIDSPVLQQRQIAALISKQDAQTWQRPAIEPFVELTQKQIDDLESQGIEVSNTRVIDERFENPIVLLTGYSNPVLLKSDVTDSFFIFLFNHRTFPGTIDMVEMNRALFLKIEDDNSQDAPDVDLPAVDESQTTLANDKEVVSYARVFKANDDGGFNHVKQALTNATQNFTAELTPNGDLYLTLLDSNGQFRIKYNRALGSGRIDTSFNWEDLGIDLLDTTTDNGDGTTGSNLSKVVNQTNMGALFLKYSEIEDILYLFIATANEASLNPGKLFSVQLPEVIIKPPGLKTNEDDGRVHFFNGVPKTDQEIDEFFQVTFNKIKPVLVTGTKEGLSSEFVEIRSSTEDEFPSQIVALEWLKNGTGQLYFVSEGRLKARKTNSSGLFWEDFPNI